MGNVTKFKDEYSLVQLFETSVLNIIPNRIGSQCSVVMKEVDAGRGRADIVCANFNETNINMDRMRLLSRSLSEITKARILSWMNKSSTCDENYIMHVTGLGKRTVQKHIHDLVDTGVIQRTPSGLIKLSRIYLLPRVDVWAFEIKLNNWKRACYQAQRYRGFSHNVAVVMPNERLATLGENTLQFKKMNIGLMGITLEGKVDVLFRPKRRPPFSKSHYLYGLGLILKEFTKLHIDAIPEVRESRSPIPQITVA